MAGVLYSLLACTSLFWGPCLRTKYFRLTMFKWLMSSDLWFGYFDHFTWTGFTPGRRDNCWRTWLESEPEGVPQSTVSTFEFFVKSTIKSICIMSSLVYKILWKSMARSLMGYHVVQYQCKSGSHHWAALRQGYKWSADEWQHGRIVKNNSWSKASISSVFNIFSRVDHVWCSRRTYWKDKNKRQNYH